MEQALFDELGLPDPHDIERGGGDDGAPPWPLHPVNTWLLVKGVAYFVCALSFLDAAGMATVCETFRSGSSLVHEALPLAVLKLDLGEGLGVEI